MRAGQIVGGRYRLEERLGSGAHGEVWRAGDLELDRPVAMKRALLGGDPAAAAKLGREARILANINHPNVVTVHDSVAEDGDAWIVMEYVRGASLADRPPASVAEAARYGAQLAAGLEAVHAKGVLHRDIKPANVMVTDHGLAKLADFGISRNVHADATLTGTGMVTGTPGYVAPEVVHGGPSTAESDVFSLGATLFHAVEGTSPFGNDNPHALILRTSRHERIAPRNAGALAPVLERMLDNDPRRRPRPERLRLELGAMSGETPVGAAAETNRLRTAAWVVSAVAAVLVLAVAALGAWRYLGPADATFGSPGASGSDTAEGDILGDPATLDPCALLDAEAFDEVGEAWLAADRGSFVRCGAIVTVHSGSEVEIELLVYRTGDEPELGEIEQEGRIAVIRHEPQPEECERTLALPDGEHYISVDAEQSRDGEADLCGIAEIAVGTAVSVMNEGQIPRLASEPDANSLIHADACALLDNEALELFPGVDATHPVTTFGGWDCTWHSTTSDQDLRVLFERIRPLTADDGEELTIAGRQVFLQHDRWSDDSCLVSIVHLERPSPDPDRTTTAEVVRLQVQGDDPVDALCDQAMLLAEPLAAALPPV